MEFKRLKPNNLDKQADDIFQANIKETRTSLIKASFIYDAKIVDNLNNVLVNVITGRLKGSHFIKSASDRLAIMVGVGSGIDYAVYVDNKRHYMERSWNEVEPRINRIMGVN